MIDLRQSRRNCNEWCRWWTRKDSDKEDEVPDELIYKRTPDGQFWAEEISPERLKNNVIGGAFLFDSSHVSIRTPDNCFGLKSEDLVQYQDEIWIVVDAQKSKARKGSTMFASDKNCPHYWYIELRK